MTTHRAIIDALADAGDSGDSTVLATVVRVTGSSYGGVGARMLVRVDGSTVGLVSGGCLESDLAEHARRVSSTGRAEVVSYDTRNDEDAPWGLGLGCNGLIEVLIEPLKPADAREIAKLLDSALGGDKPAVVATVIRILENTSEPPDIGAHALIRESFPVETSGFWGASPILSETGDKFASAISGGRRGIVETVRGCEIAFEVVMPSVRLVVCGSGPDALPIATFGVDLGWDVTVVDHRPLTPSHVSRFPGARVVHCDDAAALENTVALTPRTAAVVVSHHFERDRNYLESLLASRAGYIGMLGPRARTERMLADLLTKGVNIGDHDERLFAPVGIDIGGDGPNAIALSIIAEVSSVMGGRGAGHLRDKRGPLHAAAHSTTPPEQPENKT